MKKAVRTYQVILRRDVQQIASVSVDAYTPSEATAVANSVADSCAWDVEQVLGTHAPKVKVVPPIKGREPGKTDRRDNMDRRASKRRVSDKSRELVAARNKRP